MPELFEKIATEENATTGEELMEHLMAVEHPAMTMEPLM